MQKINAFKSSDGKIFESEEEAIFHENMIVMDAKIQMAAKSLTKILKVHDKAKIDTLNIYLTIITDIIAHYRETIHVLNEIPYTPSDEIIEYIYQSLDSKNWY